MDPKSLLIIEKVILTILKWLTRVKPECQGTLPKVHQYSAHLIKYSQYNIHASVSYILYIEPSMENVSASFDELFEDL